MKTTSKTRLLQFLYTKIFRNPLQRLFRNPSNSNLPAESFSPAQFISQLKSLESVFSLTFFLSDTDCDHQLIPAEVFESYISRLKTSIIATIGGLTVQHAEGFYKTLEGITITERIRILSMYFFDAQTPREELENIFGIYLEYARQSRQQSILLRCNDRTMLVYI